MSVRSDQANLDILKKSEQSKDHLIYMLNTLRNFRKDVSRMRVKTANLRSFFRYSVDRFFTMALGRMPVPGTNKIRKIRLKNGISLSYRLNRGDMQSVREVWLDECYRLPTAKKRNILVDLGGNIGLTSLWMSKHYSCEKVICVEPDNSNCEILRRNLDANKIPYKLVKAAIGPIDGFALFTKSISSNLGHVGETGQKVKMLSMGTLLENDLKNETIDILKLDIEGGEQALLTDGDLQWLDSVEEIIVEFHPDCVDYPRLIGILKKAGFEYSSPGTFFPGSMDYFCRV